MEYFSELKGLRCVNKFIIKLGYLVVSGYVFFLVSYNIVVNIFICK